MLPLDNQCLGKARDNKNGRSSLTGRIVLQNVNPAPRPWGWAPFIQSLILLLSSLGIALADGGAVQLHATAPPFVVTVFTDPPQCRAGQVDLSALVQEKNGPVLDAEVVASLSALEPAKASPTAAWLPPACASTAVTDLRGVPLQISHVTNRLFYSALIQIPYDGRWQLKVSIGRGTDHATLQGLLDVDRPLPPATAYWQWFLLPFLAIGGFALQQHTQKTRQQARPTTDPSIGHPRDHERTNAA